MDKKLIIGEILRPHGIRGEVKIKPLTDTPEILSKLKTVQISGVSYRILGVKVSGTDAIMALSGVADRDAAEMLRGHVIEAGREQLGTPEKGRYFIADICGCCVQTDSGEVLGVVKNVQTAGGADVFTVAGKRVLRFPFLNDLVLSVDIAAKTITVKDKRLSEVAVYEDD